MKGLAAGHRFDSLEPVILTCFCAEVGEVGRSSSSIEEALCVQSEILTILPVAYKPEESSPHGVLES